MVVVAPAPTRHRLLRPAMVSFSVYVPALMSMRTRAELPLAIELTAACTVVNRPLPSFATVMVCVIPDGHSAAVPPPAAPPRPVAPVDPAWPPVPAPPVAPAA